jgi:hypothetical protein
LAIGFGVLLNVLLATTLVWTAWMGPEVRVVGWLVLSAVWIGSVVAARDRPEDSACAAAAGIAVADQAAGEVRRGTGAEKSTEDLFSAAQAEYLQGNWFEAEAVLRRLIETDVRDADVILMLATLYRHTGRLDEAAVALERLETLDGSTKWEQEIQSERTLMAMNGTFPTPE